MGKSRIRQIQLSLKSILPVNPARVAEVPNNWSDKYFKLLVLLGVFPLLLRELNPPSIL
jgi:hypothetical protein